MIYLNKVNRFNKNNLKMNRKVAKYKKYDQAK